jgi:hypothetical protein
VKYFRHFSNASSSLKIQKIIDKMGLKGYAQYFLFLELLNEKFDGESTTVEVHSHEIQSKVRLKLGKSLTTFIQLLNDFELISYRLVGKVYIINCPILAELMDRDSKYNRSKRVENAKITTLEEEVEEDKELDLKIELKKEEKKKEEILEDSSIPLGLLNTIKTSMQYPDHVIEEVRKDAWLKYQASSKPDKEWKRFVGNYFLHEKEKIRELIVGKGQASKINPSGNSEIVAMSERIYSTVKSFGLHEYKQMLTKLSAKEKRALEIFGSVRDIHENQLVEQIKKRLRDACADALKEPNSRAG